MSFTVIATAAIHHQDNNDNSKNVVVSLVRINREDEVTTSWIQQAENLLIQQWPRGGPYKEKIIYSGFNNNNNDNDRTTSNKNGNDNNHDKYLNNDKDNNDYNNNDNNIFHDSKDSYYALPCSYLLMMIPNKENKEQTDTKNVTITTTTTTTTTAGDDNNNKNTNELLSSLSLSSTPEVVVIGHGRLMECFESAGGNAVAATFIVVDKTQRGYGWGSKMMELLEIEAVRLGYHYVYLWTQTAIPFYEKNGYAECQRVSLKRACLKSLEPNQVDGLEAMLLLRKSQTNRQQSIESTTTTTASNNDNNKKNLTTITKKETILLPPEEGEGGKELQDVWMRKRLVEHVGSIHVPMEDRIKEIENVAREHNNNNNSSKNYTWYYQLISLPWQAQIGPSCGLAALRMVREYFFLTLPLQSNKNDDETTKDDTTQLPSLLGEAQERGYTTDGEVFNVQHLKDLAETVCGIETELWPTRSLTPQRVHDILALGGVFILPYDSKPGLYVPVNLSGQRAHYGIVVGILLGVDSDDNDNDNDRHFNLQKLDGSIFSANAPVEVYLIVQHSLSQSLLIAPMEDFWESNQQLLSFDEGKFGIQDLDLKNRIVVCKALRSDYA